jgi:hypothetical protein
MHALVTCDCEDWGSADVIPSAVTCWFQLRATSDPPDTDGQIRTMLDCPRQRAPSHLYVAETAPGNQTTGRGHAVIRNGHFISVLRRDCSNLSYLFIYLLLEICRAMQSATRNADGEFCTWGQTGFSPTGSPSTGCRRAVRNHPDVAPASGTQRLRERLRA